VSQPKVFISYRRSDTKDSVGRLFDRLNGAFPGMFFRDVSGIGVGVDFHKQIERAIGASKTLIAVIGPGWLTAEEDGKRRLDDPEDFVRVEVGLALRNKLRIIPVLVNGARMVAEDQLPADLKALPRWNAIRIVEDYYDEGVQKLIDALVEDLGEPVTPEAETRAEHDARVKALMGEAEAAIAMEDWFGAVQALQAALSLDPTNVELRVRTRWAHDQRKISSLFEEGQAAYERGRKPTALAKFKQVKVAAGNYRNVDELIQLLEREVAVESRKSTMRRWTVGALGLAAVAVAIVALAVYAAVRDEFGSSDGGLAPDALIADSLPGSGTAAAAAEPAPFESSVFQASPGASVPMAAEAPPSDDDDVLPAPTYGGGVAAARPAYGGGSLGPGFEPIGLWRAVNQLNTAATFTLLLGADGTFQVQANAGVMNVPLSGGGFEYDPASGLLLLSGMNLSGQFFSEALHIVEPHDGHFHVNYAGTFWDFYPGQ
jgi:hypothetical protein